MLKMFYAMCCVQLGGGLREQINKNAYENLEKNQKQVPITVKDQSAPTERFDCE